MTAENPRFRLCRKCGERWQVSVKGKSPNPYICPKCEQKDNDQQIRHELIKTGVLKEARCYGTS